MDLSDLVYEAVKNSFEAGASKVEVEVDSSDGLIHFSIDDDGDGKFPDDPFSLNVSTKGENRGKGLFFIRESSIDASISRSGGKTHLRFFLKGSAEDFKPEDFLAPALNMGLDVVLVLKKNGKETVRFDEGTWKGLDFSKGSDLSLLRRLVIKRSKEWLN